MSTLKKGDKVYFCRLTGLIHEAEIVEDGSMNIKPWRHSYVEVEVPGKNSILFSSGRMALDHQGAARLAGFELFDEVFEEMKKALKEKFLKEMEQDKVNTIG